MTQVLQTIDNFELIAKNYKTELKQIFLIGHIDKPHHLGDVNDLVFYLGAPTNTYNWGRYILVNLQSWLLAKLVNVKEYKNQLQISDTVILTYDEHLSSAYSYTTVIVKVPNGLNYYGITKNEVYDMLVNATEYYNELLFGKKGAA